MLDKFDYGNTLQRGWRLTPPTISLGRSPSAMFGAARLKFDFTGHGHVVSQASESVYDIYLWFRDLAAPPHWLGGKAIKPPVSRFQAGAACISDITAESEAVFLNPFDGIHIRLGHEAFSDLADDLGAPRISVLRGTGLPDATLTSLVRCLEPALETPSVTTSFYLEHLSLAITAYIARQYGGMTEVPASHSGGLSPAQLRRATELMSEHLDGELTLAQVAVECGLSRSHFTFAFKQSTGMSPHRWWLQYRLDRVKHMLLETDLPISLIASTCGFFDQSHMTNVFKRFLQITPHQYRRQRR
ncbi:helix-turn-helix domain-containing protein [Lysobacter solisilvae (ex Woo and Kim 2020)]|uniref:Helix-turn-helix transcriptional regulator n=1 Tax=Agrilutibacter terrestris TaxID=2865112 RepID=A0A7H0FX24_9GAMM|nr:AraC family transcriptional regulator [Lysobacter terrestris]QNP40590.1 helix-turn-helix transcriptional regulator [Lysobacter terrestris]